jgi:hypothetical protein
MEIIGYVPFEDNREFRDFMSIRFKGEGPMYIQVADDIDNPQSVMKATPVSLNYKSCRVIKNNKGFTSMVFNGKSLRIMLDLGKLRIVKENKQKLEEGINKVKYALGDVPIAKELEGKILTLAKSIEDLYNEDEQEVE